MENKLIHDTSAPETTVDEADFDQEMEGLAEWEERNEGRNRKANGR